MVMTGLCDVLIGCFTPVAARPTINVLYKQIADVVAKYYANMYSRIFIQNKQLFQTFQAVLRKINPRSIH